MNVTIIKRTVIIAILMAVTFGAIAQTNNNPKSDTSSSIILFTKPYHLIFGGNFGAEIPINNKWSTTAEAYAHFWYVPDNLAIASTLKYYFTGKVGQGFYTRLKVIAGAYLNEVAYEDKPYYAGPGIGIGYTGPIAPTSRFGVILELGLKFAFPFGHTTQGTIDGPNFGVAYQSMIGPSSMPELGVGFTYRL